MVYQMNKPYDSVTPWVHVAKKNIECTILSIHLTNISSAKLNSYEMPA